MTLLKLLTPTNLLQEKARFFASNNYQPVFKYNWNKNEINNWLNGKPKYRQLATAVLNQETEEIVSASKQLFETDIVPNLLQEANSILNKSPQKLQRPTKNEIVTAFNKAFELLELHEYSIKVSEKRGFFFRPSYKNKTITVSKHAQFDFFSLNGEVKHELTHIIRYENGKANNIPRSENYLPTEEGLASYFQDYTGKNGESSLFQHAAEYAVTEVGLNGSLKEMIEFLQEKGFSKELAWQRAVRHKFGFIDTSKPGDIMKPSMYFYGQQKIKKLSDNERLRLLVGKISLADLANYNSYEGRISKEKLADFYSIDN